MSLREALARPPPATRFALLLCPLPRYSSGARLAARSAWGMDARTPLFCTANGRCIAQGFLRRLLKELARKASIDRRVHIHGLRHTHAAQLRCEGVDTPEILKSVCRCDYAERAS